jgi:NitT/TauT family transport system substrate-binding protein
MQGRLRSLGRALIPVLVFAAGLAPGLAQAQAKPPVVVRYTEVVRSAQYAPSYVAISRGFFKDAGLDIRLSTAGGGDKAMASLLGNGADIALIGPETTVYVWNSESPVKVKIFAGLTTTDGFMLMGRTRVDKFDWKSVKGKQILGFRPGSTPLLFLEAALRQNGIDPQKDVKLVNNVAFPARVGSWLAGQNDLAIFQEPDASQLEADGKAFTYASVGGTVGFADYTSFMATEKFIRENPQVVQAFTDAMARAMKWTETASNAELVKVLAEFFPGVNLQTLATGVDRYRKMKMWRPTPIMEPGPIEKFQDILVQGGVLDKSKRVKFDDIIVTTFAKNASANVK